VKGQLHIDELYAFIVLDSDGTEGVPAVSCPSEVVGLGFGGIALLPLMGADMKRVEALRVYVQHDPMLKGRKVTLARFSVREDLEVIQR